MESCLLFIVKGVLYFLLSLFDGAVGMWLLGGLFPVLSYWNWVALAFVFSFWAITGITVSKMEVD